MDTQILAAFFLGFLEGLTEFIPVSSTAHLLLIGPCIGFESKEKIFEVFIQTGAILALPSVYWFRLKEFFLKKEYKTSQSFFVVKCVMIAFFPSALLGFFAHNFIKIVLFESKYLICIMLILGGIVLTQIDRFLLSPLYFKVTSFPLNTAFKIGLFQCLALVPGVSRSGATLVGGLLCRADKKSAMEFTFLLAFPSIFGASFLDLVKNRAALSIEDIPVLGAGFLGAFLTAFVIIHFLIDYVSKCGYSLFGWWRIALGTIGLIALSM